jgi:hypothetical protein
MPEVGAAETSGDGPKTLYQAGPAPHSMQGDMLRGFLLSANPVRVSCQNRSACRLTPWGMELTRAVLPPLAFASEYRSLDLSGTGGGDIWGHLATVMSQTGQRLREPPVADPNPTSAGGFGLLRHYRARV